MSATQQVETAARARPRTIRAALGAVQSDERRLGRLLVFPGVALLVFLVSFPIVVEIYIALTSWTPISGTSWYLAYREWAWFENFRSALTNMSFLASVLRTAVITVAAVGIEFVLGFALALLFVEKFPLRRLAMVAMLVPMMIVPAVSGFVFFLLLQRSGPVNELLSLVVPGEADLNWLSDPLLAPISVVLVDVWQWTPLMFLILLSGLLAVPEEQLNAARILGASWSQRLRLVVLPIMTPIIVIALIIRGMEAFKIFDAAWLLTQGGPGEASATISVKLYREAFLSAQWSTVAAMAILVLIAVSIVASQAVKPLQARQEANT